MKVLVATDKPFAKVAVDGIRKEIEAAGYELVLLEKYGEKAVQKSNQKWLDLTPEQFETIFFPYFLAVFFFIFS